MVTLTVIYHNGKTRAIMLEPDAAALAAAELDADKRAAFGVKSVVVGSAPPEDFVCRCPMHEGRTHR